MSVSVIVIVKNEEHCIRRCLAALLAQSYPEFEILLVDNGSTDGTRKIIRSFSDQRIKYIYEPYEHSIAELRNKGIRASTGNYIFFTDGDCVPSIFWLKEGLRTFQVNVCAGVEGKTFYESPGRITIADINTHQFETGEFMTCNIAYMRNILEKVQLFDPMFRHGSEDRDLAFRVMKIDKIVFSPDMLVAHQKKRLTPKSLFERTKRVEDKVYLIKKHGWGTHRKHGPTGWPRARILNIESLLIILCPPFLILTERYTSCNDILLGFFKYLSYIYERLLIWKSAIKHRVFVL